MTGRAAGLRLHVVERGEAELFGREVGRRLPADVGHFLARPDAESAALPREDEPLEEPVAVGLVRLDGADAVLFHRLIGDGFEIGMRVEAVLGSEPTGSILDVAGFRKES